MAEHFLASFFLDMPGLTIVTFVARITRSTFQGSHNQMNPQRGNFK